MKSAAPTTSLPQRLFEQLVPAQVGPARRFQSGTDLASRLGVTRSAIWKAVSHLRELGVAIEAVPRQGYRLASHASPLTATGIDRLLSGALKSRLRQGETRWTLGSTNAELLSRTAAGPGRFDYLTAEYQTAGRGRRGRSWLAPPGGALCLSWSWTFESLPSDIGALSLVIGVCALRALAACGVQGVSLKWPNDLLIDGAKLGGILIELKSEAGGPAHVVVGIGLNVALDRHTAAQVVATGTRPADLQGRAPGLQREPLAAALLSAAIPALLAFPDTGLLPCMTEFAAADALLGRAVIASGAHDNQEGIALGIDASGALLLETKNGLRRIISGEVSVRAAS